MAKSSDEPLTYAAYLRVPELLAIQSPLGDPPVHDEMLFVILQQAQELWFKQVLHELRLAISALDRGALLEARRVVDRINRIMRVLAEEVEVMETIQQAEFQRFRHLLTPSSGFESYQYREMEYASGLRDESFLKMIDRIFGRDSFERDWPLSLHDAFLGVLSMEGEDPINVLVRVYGAPAEHPEMFALAEALSEYEVRFQTWRFRHVKLVERAIGDRSPGTGGSAGSGYLVRTLSYRFFPELWEARNRLSAGSGVGTPATS